jgi:colanic acid biosynthesis glycosyl transferase WcaI
MRILFINQYFPPDASATAYILGELTEDLARHHEVHVVAATPSYNAASNTFEPAGVHVHRARSTTFHRGAIAGRLANYATFLATSAWLSLRVPRPDLIVALTDPPPVGVVALIAARRFGCPFVFVSHDVHPDIGLALGRLDNPILVWGLRRINRLLRRAASHIIVVGRDMKEKLIGEGVDAAKLTYLPNWAEIQAPFPVTDTRKQMGWDRRLVVMHAGNMGLAQNLGIVVEAAKLLEHRLDILFVLMGDGAAREGLEAAVKHLGLANVAFEPYRPKRQAQELVGAADVHLVTLIPGLKGCAAPSKVYGIMATGRPIVAAVDAGSEPDLVLTEHSCGIRIAPGDAAELAKALSDLTPGALEEMGQRARAGFLAHYSREIVTAGYRETLELVLSSRSRRRG